MFGRVRPSSSSLDSLERPPSKLFKDDPLSIYETTLMKLKLGSQRNSTSPSPKPVEELMESDNCSCMDSLTSCAAANVSEQLVDSPHVDTMAIDTHSSSASTQSTPSSCQSTADSKQLPGGTMPILYLFSKYNVSSRHSVEHLTGDASFGSTITISPTSTNCQSFGSTNEQLEHECHS